MCSLLIYLKKMISKLIKINLVRLAALFYNCKRSKVIFYHDIHDAYRYTSMSTPMWLFKKHINILQGDGYEIVSSITKEYGQIEICFDDAFLGIYDNIEFLKNHNIPVHLFVVSSYLGLKNHLTRKQLSELSRLDIITISSHTHTHKILNQIDDALIEGEFIKSKEYLEALLHCSIDSICYPEGKFDKRVIDIASKVGYKKQYSSLPGFFINKFNSSIIARSLVQFAREKEFKAIISGGDHILAFWYKFKHFKR